MTEPPQSPVGARGEARAPPARVRHSISRETRPPPAGRAHLRPAEAACLFAGLRLRPPQPAEIHTPPTQRAPSPAADRPTAQRVKRSRCLRRGSGSSPTRLSLCFLRFGSAGPALRITPGRHTESHSPGRGGEGRGRAGRWETERRSRRGDLSSREGSGLWRLLCGNFKLPAKEH